MEKRMDGLLVDVLPPEKPKFRSPLVLVHSLWTGSWCWRPWATHFSNLGWECWAANFRGRGEERRDQSLQKLTLQDCVADLKRILSASSSPAVLLAHGLGGLVAQKAAEEEKVSALILVSSLPPSEIQMVVPRALRLLRLKYSILIFLRRPFGLKDTDFRRSWLSSLPGHRHPDILKRMVPDSAHLVGEFFKRRVGIDPRRIGCPVLVVVGREDRVVPAGAQREMAERLGADLKEYPGRGHWIMAEDGGEEMVKEIHRWVVQKLGQEILLADLSEHP